MNKINRKLEYALMALKHMSLKSQGELSSAKEIAQQLATPFEITARVMQSLASGGLVKAEYGASGGYFLQKDLSRVSLLDLIDIVEGPTRIAKCMSKETGCDIESTCNIVNPMTRLNARVNEFYGSITLRELLETKKRSEVHP